MFGRRALILPSAGREFATRNLIEVMRTHAPWYKWFSFGVNFPERWVGFFVVLALVRGRPRYLTALVRGMRDFVRRRLGPREDP